MTTTLARPAPSLRFHDRGVFWPVVGLTMAVTAVSVVAQPAPAWLSGLLVMMVIVGLGIPHGAFDHLVAEAVDGRYRRNGRMRFVRNYVLAMAAVSVTWLFLPPAVLLGFLVVSVHHFGQSDLSYLRAPGGSARRLLQWSRGLFLIGLPLVAHPDAIAPVVDRLGGGNPSTWLWLVDRSWFWSLVLVAQHLAVLAAVARRIGAPTIVAREFVGVVVLSSLFVAADPLIGFALYFGLWHAVAHLLVLAEVVGSPSGSVRSLVRLGVPITLVSVAGLAFVVAVVAAVGRVDLVVPVAFVLISVVTLPHSVVVERLWRSPIASTLRRP